MLFLIPVILFGVLGYGINNLGWFVLELPYNTPYYFMFGVILVGVLQLLRAKPTNKGN